MGTLISLMPNRITPTQLSKALYRFLQPVKMQVAAREASILVVSYQVRLILAAQVLELQAHLPKLGGPDRIVAFDCTFFTKRKRAKGGFAGRVTSGRQVTALRMVELDLWTHRETDNVRLTIVPRESKLVVVAAVKRYVVHGALIFTDSNHAYSWLPKAGYVHRRANHTAGEFSRDEVIFGEIIRVNTNSAGGLFGRLMFSCSLAGIQEYVV